MIMLLFSTAELPSLILQSGTGLGLKMQGFQYIC